MTHWLWRVFKPDSEDVKPAGRLKGPGPVGRRVTNPMAIPDRQYVPPSDADDWGRGVNPPRNSPEHRAWLRWVSASMIDGLAGLLTFAIRYTGSARFG